MAIVEAACHLPSSALVVCGSTVEADQLEREMALYAAGKDDMPPVLHFPDWETLPYDTFSPHQDIISARMRTLYQLSQGQRCIVVISAATLAQRIAPASYIRQNSLLVKVGDTLGTQSFTAQLVSAGYRNVDTVIQHGEFAVRGALVDVFPMGGEHAFRIELFDDEVDTLRTFDTETQRTIAQVESIDLLPAKECPNDARSVARFKATWYERFEGDARGCPVFEDVAAGLSPAGVEYYLPLFFDQTASLLDYLNERTTVFVAGELEANIEKFWREATERYESRRGDLRRPILAPQELFLSVVELFTALKPLARITLVAGQVEPAKGKSNFACKPPTELNIDAKAPQPLAKLETYLMTSDRRVLFCAESSGRRETLLEQLANIGVTPEPLVNIDDFVRGEARIAITVAPLEAGFEAPDDGFAIIAEAQLYGTRVRQVRRRRSTPDDQENVIKNLTELKIGAPVVHLDHGVGRYRGLTTLTVGDQVDEFLVLEYANASTLYVPVANLHLISRYTGGDEQSAPLHRLGSDQWQKAKRKAAEKIRDVAAELLEIYARRKAKKGFSYRDADSYQQFAASFPYEETPDQHEAIEAVRRDMRSDRPMDRLVCGDVGFGKTEVALRAAFIAVQNNRQVVVLVPTTLLAQQHYENFKDRFSDWPVTVDVVSRFRSAKDTTAIQKRVAEGKVDILIGTHRLLQGDLKFPDLGLVIIDEEHRFGVRQKEALKAMRAEVDILTMTATPIPRTLNMAMHAIRDLSIIATPPAKRLSVKTFVREFDKATVKEALLREIMRGGQVYYLHNEVQTIERTARELSEMIPEARVRVGHGQMRERDLEAVMGDFYHKRFNVLVCSTIIETGIDVPTANTIVIERADKFGLAQLHQLRGRVGRSHHQAYAYLLTPNAKAMTDDAHKRLKAIEESQDLGAGFMLASHDLEIRGAGELLGEDQSGQIHAVGFSLYMEMLDRAVKAIQSGKIVDLNENPVSGVDINLRIPALIPDDYLPDVNTRLILYKRLANVADEAELEALQVEMIDRFGLLPDATKNLIRVTRLKLLANELGIVKLEATKDHGRIEFAEKTSVDPLKIVALVQSQPQKYRLEGATLFKFRHEMATTDARIKATHQLLLSLVA